MKEILVGKIQGIPLPLSPALLVGVSAGLLPESCGR
jgi:hypothetical protein